MADVKIGTIKLRVEFKVVAINPDESVVVESTSIYPSGRRAPAPTLTVPKGRTYIHEIQMDLTSD